MALKLIVLAALIAIAYAGIEHHEEPHHDAHYHFKYAVDDHHTGDKKSHEESRHGHKVEGKYTVVDPDGHKRIVKYTADKHSGFEAKVTREHTHHHIPEPVHHHEHEHKHESTGSSYISYSDPHNHYWVNL